MEFTEGMTKNKQVIMDSFLYIAVSNRFLLSPASYNCACLFVMETILEYLLQARNLVKDAADMIPILIKLILLGDMGTEIKFSI